VTSANIARGSCAVLSPLHRLLLGCYVCVRQQPTQGSVAFGPQRIMGVTYALQEVPDSLVLGGPFNPSFRRPPSDAQNSHRRCCHRQHRRALELPLNHCPNDFIVLSVHVFQSCIALLWQMGHTAEQSPRPREVPQ
jgi:hypothetical protein